jgi:hypothetical protein
MIYYYMNLNYPCNFFKLLKLLLTLQNKIKDENDTIKQAQFNGIE